MLKHTEVSQMKKRCQTHHLKLKKEQWLYHHAGY